MKGRRVKRQIVVATVCLLIAFGQAAIGQSISPNQSPVLQLQPPRKSKPVRIQGSPKPVLDGKNKGTPGKDQNQNQGQVNPGNSRQGNVTANANKRSYAEALRNYRRERHDRNWWKQHFTVIVLVGGGYYYWDAGYWCPAWGYDPGYESYDYDGPIYTYGNLLPDQVILNVQRALKQLGYYAGGLTGSLGASTRQALASYQQDAGLDVTGAIDAATVEALGLLG